MTEKWAVRATKVLRLLKSRCGAYVVAQHGRGSVFRTLLALGETDGVPGPVIQQLVQVVGEGALPLLGVRGGGGGGRCLRQGNEVLGVSRTVCGAALARSWKPTETGCR